MDKITLYPSNWLYNAGVVGWLISTRDVEKMEIEDWFKNDGTAEIPIGIFDKLDVNRRYFADQKIFSIVGKSQHYRNYINPSRNQDKEGFKDFVKELKNLLENVNSCSLCSTGFNLSSSSINSLNQKWLRILQNQTGKKQTKTRKKDLPTNDFEVFLNNITRFTNTHSSILGPALTEFPNGFWNLNQSLKICSLCAFLIIQG